MHHLPLFSFGRVTRRQWTHFGMVFAVCVLTAAAPEIALAATAGKFAPDDATARDFIKQIRLVWTIIANVAGFGGLAIAVIGVMFGLGQRPVLWGGTLIGIAAFGEVVARWAFNISGFDWIAEGGSALGR